MVYGRMGMTTKDARKGFYRLTVSHSKLYVFFVLLSLTSIAKVEPQKYDVVRKHEKGKHNNHNG